MSQIANRLTRHHRDCDACFAQLENAVDRGDWGAAESAYARFRDELESHFRAEEQVLFPRFESRTGMTQGPTTVMRQEHDMMREQLISLAEALEQRDAERFLGDSDTLLVLMQQHNMKEESVLYPACDAQLHDEVEALASDIAACIEAGRQ